MQYPEFVTRDGGEKRLADLALPAGIVPPLGLSVLWQVLNKAYPEQATAGFFELAQDFFLNFKSSGLLSTLELIYQRRDWRGFVLPAFGLPALIVTDGRVQLAHALTALGFFLVFLIYVSLVLRNFLPPWRAALATVLVGCVPWVQQAGHDFNSEMPMVLAIVALCFHGIRLRTLESLGHGLAFGAWLAFGCCIRPAEMFLVFSVPLVIWAVRSVREKKLGWRDVLAPLVQCAIFAYYVVSSKSPSLSWQWIFFAPAVALLLLRRPLGMNRVFTWTFQIFYLPLVIWWLPSAANLWSWVHRSSFWEDDIHVMGGVSSGHFILKVLGLVGGWPLLALTLIALVVFALQRSRIPKGFWFDVPWMITVPVLVGSMSHNEDPRYYVDIGIILWMTVSVILLGSWLARPLVRRTAVVTTCMFFGWVAMVTLLDPDTKSVPAVVAEKIFPDYFRSSMLWGYKKILVQPREPWLAVVESLERMAPREFGRYDVLYYCHLIFDPHKTDVIAREHGRQWVFAPGGSPGDYAEVEEMTRYMKEHPDFLVIACPPDHDRAPIAQWFAETDSAGKLGQFGFSRLGQLPWDNIKVNTMTAYRRQVSP